MNFRNPNDDIHDLPLFETSNQYKVTSSKEKKYSKQLNQIAEDGYAILDLDQPLEIF